MSRRFGPPCGKPLCSISLIPQLVLSKRWLAQKSNRNGIEESWSARTLHSLGTQVAAASRPTRTYPTPTRLRVRWQTGPCSRKAPPAGEGSYLVDPASSHMLVSKIKPCMSKYELIQTVKLRMAH